MAHRIGLVLAVLALVGGLLWWLLDDDMPAPVPETAEPAGASEDPEAGPTLLGNERTADGAILEPEALASGSVRGRVLLRDGGPVPDVEVVAYLQLDAPNAHGREGVRNRLQHRLRDLAAATRIQARAQADADGMFLLEGLRPDTHYLLHAQVSAPLLSTGYHVEPGTQRETVRLYVARGTPLRGRLVDRNGDGIRGFVHGEMWSWGVGVHWSSHPVATDAEGRFHFPAAPAGEVSLDAEVPGVGGIEGYPVRMPHAEEVVLRFDTTGGATIRGTVRTTDGRPVARALLGGTVTRADGRRERVVRVGRTQNDGTYVLAGFPAGSLTKMELTAPGFVHRTNVAVNRYIAANSAHEIDVVLVRGASVRGRVVTPDGAPVPRAHVALAVAHVRHHWNLAHEAIRADDEGRFRFEDLAPSGPARILAIAPGYYQRRGTPATHAEWGVVDFGHIVSLTEEGQVVEADIVLERAVPVHGRVTKRDGSAVAGARVQVSTSWDGAFDPWDGLSLDPLRTGEDGAFTHPGLPPRTWTFSAKHGTLVGRPTKVTVADGPSPPPVHIVVGGGGSISGRTQTAAGKPAPHVPVTAQHLDNVTSDGQGRFKFENVPPGKYTLNSMTGPFVTPVSADEGDIQVGWEQAVTGIVVEVAMPRPVGGVVVDEAGNRLPHAPISVAVTGPTSHMSMASRSDFDGAFHFDDLPQGKIKLSTPSMDEPLVLLEARTDIRLVGKAREPFVVRGTVLLPDGTPAPHGEVVLRHGSEGNMNSENVVFSDGEFRVEIGHRPPTADVHVRNVRDRQFRPASVLAFERKLDVEATEPLTLQLQPGLRVAGHVLDAAGRPITGVRLGVRPDVNYDNQGFFHRAPTTWVVSDDQGAFSVGGLAKGPVHVEVKPPPTWTSIPRIDARAGDEKLRIVLPKAATIEGLVLAPDGSPLAGVTVNCAGKGTHELASRAHTDTEGRFVLRSLDPELRYGVQVRKFSREGRDYLGRTVEDVAAGTTDLTVRLRAGARITGQIETEDGAPVPAGCFVQISAKDGSWMSDNAAGDDGSFSHGPLEAGTYRVLVRGTGDWGRSEPIEVRAPAHNVRLTLPRGYPIKGVVANAGAHRYHVHALVNGKSVATTKTDSEGRFVIPHHEQRTVTLFAQRTDGDRFATLPNVTGRSEVTLDLRPGKTITGRIEGVALLGISKVYATQGGMFLAASVDDEGAFRFAGVPDGAWKVFSRDASVEVKSGVAAGAQGIRLGPAPQGQTPAPNVPSDWSDPDDLLPSCGGGGASCG